MIWASTDQCMLFFWPPLLMAGEQFCDNTEVDIIKLVSPLI
jgi:hypothetical protein